MNCCNYVQPYAGTGHFYQQHHLFYENMNAYGSYAAAPVSSIIETNAFPYNRLPPAYPTDYVYNPKEARLRKAIREQNRELSRQSILQGAIVSTSESAAASDVIVGTSTGNFPNHPLTCATAAATASPLSGSSSINANRIISPWFPVGHAAPTSHLKPILTPRVMAAHQRTIDKTKEVIRKQLESTSTGAFSGMPASNYSRDFAAHNVIGTTTPENNDYCVVAEFSDGQKWHPYQNSPNSYHLRNAPVSKVGSMHRNVQTTSPHRPAHWSQFCGIPLPNPSQNTAIRSPRHMVFLPEQQRQRCGYTDEMSFPYGSNKVDVSHRLHPAYQQDEHQISDLEKETAPPLRMSQLQAKPECTENGSRWESPVASVSSVDTPISSNVPKSATRCEKSVLHQREQPAERPTDTRQFASDRVDHKQKAICKQPLPGFHQAFGSTEIGRFSRSEFFANMIGDNNVSNNDGGCISNSSELPRNCVELPNNCAELPSDCLESPTDAPISSIVIDNASNDNVSMGAYYSDARSTTPTTPRWHIPYVNAVVTEI